MKTIFLILFCLGCAATAFAQTRLDYDTQVWNDTQFIVPLDKKKEWNATVWVFGRFGENVKTTTDARIGALITKRVNKYATVGGGHLYRYANPTFRRGVYDNRFLGIATFTVPLPKKFTLVNRNLYQYESRNSRPDTTVIRNRFWLRREISIGETKIEPFVAFEQFYDLRLDAFARNRIQVGASRRFNSKFSGDFFFVRQNEGGGGTRPVSLNGVGSSLRVNF